MLPLLHRFFLFAFLISGLPGDLFRPGFWQADDPPAETMVEITAPAGGEAVQGSVRVTGSASAETFARYELAFSYPDDPTGTWFLIAERDEPVQDAALADWDTFSITDGDYDLRLVVFLTDGSTQVHNVTGVRIRNYSLVETSTPAPAATATATPPPDLSAPAPGMSETPLSTATPLPPNPAAIRPGAIPLSLARGAAGVLAAFVLLGLYTSFRRIRRK